MNDSNAAHRGGVQRRVPSHLLSEIYWEQQQQKNLIGIQLSCCEASVSFNKKMYNGNEKPQSESSLVRLPNLTSLEKYMNNESSNSSSGPSIKSTLRIDSVRCKCRLNPVHFLVGKPDFIRII